VLVEEGAAPLDVPSEEGGGGEGHGHHLGTREAALRIVAMSGAFEEVVAKSEVGGYGIFHRVLPCWMV
jgi:hypothetical protein